MYWPAGAPKIYSASSNKTSRCRNVAFDDEVKPQAITEYPNDLKADTETELFDPTQIDLKEREHGIAFKRGTSPTSNFNRSPVIHVGQDSNSQLSSLWHDTESVTCDYPDDLPLLSLKISRSGHIFAAITSVSLTVWQSKPTVVLAVAVRSKQSLQTYGPNVSLLMRPDSRILVVLTKAGYLITYSLAIDPNSRVYKPYFSNNNSNQNKIQSRFGGNKGRGEDSILRGPGEGDGAREITLRSQLLIQIIAGAGKALALNDELVVAIHEPPAIQCIRWDLDCHGSQRSTALFSKMDWLPGNSKIIEMIHDCPMNLSAWITNDGKAYAVQKPTDSNESTHLQNIFKGYCFHVPNSPTKFAIKAAINARFSLIAVGCIDGTIQIYTARDYAGNILPSHVNKSHVSENTSGNLTCLAYSPDGYCLFVGYDKGWAMWSVFGKQGATSFGGDPTILREQDETWLEGVQEAVWLGGGLEILLIGQQDHRIWALEMSRSATTSCFGLANMSRMLLQTNSKVAVYRGYDLPNQISTSPESTMWHFSQVPSTYLADQWPMRYTVISSDGRYIAVAGRRGLAHYSVSSGRWKTFSDLNMENEFQIRGGMCWYQHILVAAIEAEQAYQLRLFSREADLSISSILHKETLPAPVVLITLSGEDSLLVYTYDNILYHFIFMKVKDNLKLVQVGQIAFHGIVSSPARVRGLSWILPDDEQLFDDPSKEVTCATLLFLVDGKLVLLQPLINEDRELKYDMRVIARNVEFYVLMRDLHVPAPNRKPGLITPVTDEKCPKYYSITNNHLKNSLWIFEGTEMKGWINVEDVLQSTPLDSGRELPPMVSIPIDFYPISFLLDRGIVHGLESEIIQRRDVKFAHFKLEIRAHLFIPYILQFQLSNFDQTAALNFAQSFQGLDYFVHSLELLLHNVLDHEVDTCPTPENALLPVVISFLSSFPQYLDIIVQCTRKTEIRSWRTLFKYLPSPQELFEKSLQQGSLKTAGGYLLIIQSFEDLSSSSEQLIRLFLKAKERKDWTLCKELANFLIALDQSGSILCEAVELLSLNSPMEEREKTSLLLEKIQANGNFHLSEVTEKES